MNTSLSAITRRGFTLIEVLMALGICALLAAATAAAISFAARAERMAIRSGEAALLLPSLYAAQRLHPDDPPVSPRGWRVEHDTRIVELADDLFQEWHTLSVTVPGHEIPPFTLHILGDAP
ncbi:MAG: prepilin-type N-terminal cleavage/methylation domain-containing protein [Kiritimatiellae bacterium]|nr:prepilin-type N-terminal cleavage/methylation domain-containing protein [Kiritimatiellia bacterium]NLD89821.1 prepilin-type N-terminal cleavage/methylation domain-containing protein [Lentisphaerota bacterium]